MNPDFDYLDRLIAEAKNAFDMFCADEADTSGAVISFMATKKDNFLGLKLGPDGQAAVKKSRSAERDTIRAGCKYYHRIYRLGSRIVRIDDIVDGCESTYWLAHYENDRRYLFPFRNGKRTPSYIIVTHSDGDNVTEEYMVNGNQIVYERYGLPDSGSIAYYCINYVSGGKYPILGESAGLFQLPSLEYTETAQSVWYQTED